MGESRNRHGLLVAALGAVLMAIAVFLPWYGVSFTAGGIAAAQRLGQEVVQQYGNAALQSVAAAPLHSDLGSLAGRELGSLSAHQSLKFLNVALLVIAALALLDALVPLVRSERLPAGAGGALALLGAIGSGAVLYRIIYPPTPAGGFISLGTREGAWLALAGALMLLTGGLWPRVPLGEGRRTQVAVEGALAGLSGWTPQA